MTLTQAPSADLSGLAEEINREHVACLAAAVSALQHALRAGDALLRARELVADGEWERWVDENCPALQRQARPYMRLASYREAIPEGVDGITEGLKALRGLPAFDGTGPARHPPELRDEALRLLDKGLSNRQVAHILEIDRKAVERWRKQRDGEEPERRRAGTYRQGRPTVREQKRRERIIHSERAKRAIGPAALANGFRAVWDAHRGGSKHALVAALDDLGRSANEWANQLRATVEGRS